MKRFLVGLLTTTMAIGASAQAQPMQASLTQNMYKGKLGLSHVRNLSDAQLQAIGNRNGALALPTKAEAAKMIQNARKAKTKKGMARIIANGPEAIIATGKYKESDFLLKESFESWDGRTFNWRPAGWTHFSNFDPETYISEAEGECPTWMAYETDGYYAPYATDGNFVLLCMNSSEKKGADGTTILAPAPQQDEWMVSSTVNNVQASNYLSFDLAFTPLYSHLFADDPENPEVDLDRLAYDVEVLVTTSTRSATNDEKQYTRIFKLSDITTPMIDREDLTEEIVAQLMGMRWQHFKLSLKEYAGKNIRIAFRYKGTKAGAVLLDAIRVSDMLPVALFDRPNGSFYWGFSTDARLNFSKNVLMPAYIETVWKNYSNVDCETMAWRYNVNEASGTSSDYNLTMPAANPGFTTWPTLQANAGMRADEYNGGQDITVQGQNIHSDNGTAKIGGDCVMTYDLNGTATKVDFGVGNFDATKLYWLGEISETGGAYAFGSGSGAFWASMTNNQYSDVRGIANVFEAPAAPYVFNRVTLPMGAFFNLGATIVCTVYEAKELENGGIEVTDNVLGEATTVDGIQISGGFMLSFDFANIMTITTPICIKISGFDNSNLLECAPLTQAKNHDNNNGYAFVILKNMSSGGEWWAEIAGALSAVEGSGNMEVSHCIGMNAIFPYLHSNDGDIFDASKTGETKSFDIDSYWYPEKLDAGDQLNGWTVTCSDSWVKAKVTLDKTAQKAGIDITADAIPSGIAGRKATVTIKALGCEETITVTQGEVSGIEGVTVNGFTTAAGTYNISGQRISNNKAKNGIFIENRGGKFVKVLK